MYRTDKHWTVTPGKRLGNAHGVFDKDVEEDLSNSTECEILPDSHGSYDHPWFYGVVRGADRVRVWTLSL